MFRFSELNCRQINLNSFLSNRMSLNMGLPWKKAKSVCKNLNTKEFCFLCLKTTKIKIENNEDQNRISADHSLTNINQPVSLRCVRRHLKFNLGGVFENTLLEGSEDEIEVDLCNGCEKVIKKFSVLFQELEKVQMEMDYQLEKINQCISEGAECPELVQEYSKRMTSDVETLSQLALIDKIRKEISQKCQKVRIGPYQTVEMPRVNIESTTIPSTLRIEQSAIKDISGEPEVCSSSLSPSFPNTYQDNENELNCDEPEIKPKLHKNNESSKRFVRNSLGKFQCPACDKTYTSKQRAQAHYDSVHLNKTWKCDKCRVKVFKSCSRLQTHRKYCKELLEKELNREKSRQHFIFGCATCGKRFAAKAHLQHHEKAVHSKAKFACGSCNKTFKTLIYLKSHRNSVHPAIAVPCKYCSTKFKNYRTCYRHQKKCPQRPAIKSDTRLISRPILPDETGKFPCPSCTKTFSGPAAARLHYKSVHVNKLNCDLCKLAVFADHNGLAMHKKTCLETLQQRLNDQEIRNSFQFQCQTCDKKFKSRKCLTTHVNSAHPIIRRFRCDYCDKSFKIRRHLREHRDSVHFRKTHPCKFCNQVFTLGSLYRHRKQCEMKNKGITSEATTGS